MSHYTNPAFCQKSEYYPRSIPRTGDNHCQRTQSTSCPVSKNVWTSQSVQFNLQYQQNEQKKRIQQRKLPPKPGPKPTFHLNEFSKNELNSSGYALVPINEIPCMKRDNYAILPLSEAHKMQNISSRLSKSQDNLDCVSPESFDEEEDSFTSLPAFSSQENKQKIISAFSTDFINKSMILVDQNSMQRYAIVPTDDDEDVVDSNHEIIEMHNGRAHRYAIIPTDDDETSMSEGPKAFSRNAFNISENRSQLLDARAIYLSQNKHEASVEPKPFHATGSYLPLQFQLKPKDIPNIQENYSALGEELIKNTHGASSKNPIATQKLHELLSTPRKCKEDKLQRHGSYQTISTPTQFQLQELSPRKMSNFTPQKLQYEDKKLAFEQRTTAIISPRLHRQEIYNDTTLCVDKDLPHESFRKVESATATIGIISLMLILTGILNSGLCLYMVTDVRIQQTFTNQIKNITYLNNNYYR